MPRTRRQQSTTAAAAATTTTAQRKRKKPDDEGSLASASSFDDDSNNEGVIVAKKIEVRKRSSPRKRPSRKRERLGEPASKEEQVVVLETKAATKLTPKKRSLQEVEEESSSSSSSYNNQRVTTRKAGAGKREETSKRSKLSSASSAKDLPSESESESASDDPASINQEALNAAEDALTTSPTHAAAAAADGPVEFLNHPAEQEENEIAALFLPPAISASVDESSDGAVHQALVTPMQQPLLLPQAAINDHDNVDVPYLPPARVTNDKTNESSSSNTSGDDAPSLHSSHHGDHQLPPVHVSTEKAELLNHHIHDHHQHKDEASDKEEAHDGEGNDAIITPRSLLHSLEQDDDSAPIATTTTTATTEEEGGEVTSSNNVLEVPSVRVPQVPQHQQRTVRWQQPPVQEEPFPSRQTAFSHSASSSNKKNQNKASRPHPLVYTSIVAAAVVKSPTVTSTRVVSPSAIMMEDDSTTYRICDDDDDDETHHTSVINNIKPPTTTTKTTTTTTRRKSRLLIVFLALFKMIAVAEIIAIGMLVAPRWILNSDDVQNTTTSEQLFRTKGTNMLTLLVTNNDMYKNNAEFLKESSTKLVASMNEMRQDVAFVVVAMLEDGRESLLASVDKMQTYSSTLPTTTLALQDGREMLSKASNKLREEYSGTVQVVMQDGKEILWAASDMIREYSRDALVVLDDGRTRLLELVNKMHAYLATLLANGGHKVLDTMNQLGDFVESIRTEELVVPNAAPGTDERVEVQPSIQPILPSKTQQQPKEMNKVVAASIEVDNAMDTEPQEHSQDYPIDERDEAPSEALTEQIRELVSKAKTYDELKNDQQILPPLTSRVLDAIHEEATPDTKPADGMDTQDDSLPEDENESEWESTDESDASFEPEAENPSQSTPQENAGDSTEELEASPEPQAENPPQDIPQQNTEVADSSKVNETHRREESEKTGNRIDQTLDYDSESHMPMESETESHAEQKDSVMNSDVIHNLGLSENRVRLAESMELPGKADTDEASLTDTTIDSAEDLDELREALDQLDLASDGVDDETTSPEPNEQESSFSERPSIFFRPKLLTLAAMLNSTVSKSNALISTRLKDAKNFLLSKENRNASGKRGKRGLRKGIASLLSRFKTILHEQKTAKSARLNKKTKKKETTARRRLPQRAQSLLANLKASIEAPWAIISNRLKPKKEPRGVLTMSPVQLREPVGAPIFEKYQVSKKSNDERTANKLQKARKEDDSKHPGKVGREVLRKVRSTIATSGQAMVQWAKRRFLATKSLLRQDSIEESML